MSWSVLLFGDESFVRETRALLSRDAFEVWAATAQDDALTMFTERSPDALVLLLDAPGAERLLRAHAGRGVPTVVLTVDDHAAREALKQGATEALPLGWMDTLPARLRSLLRLCMPENVVAGRDALTGCLDRHGFVTAAAAALAARAGETWELQMWDIDHFKVVNELCGTREGDRLLCGMAEALGDLLGDRGVYARLDSDHFALCCPSSLFAPDELRRAVNERVDALNASFRVTIYAGVYPGATADEDVSLMCDRANLALKTVKGKYHVHTAVYDDALRQTMLMEQELIADMGHALQNREFVIYLQPLYSLTSGEPISAEALVRWQHPRHGLLSPGMFVPLFERNGFITKLDAYVWEEACRYLQSAGQKGKPVLPISVNVSRLNLYNANLAQEIIALAARYQIDPGLLKLEITESCYTDNPQQLLEAMKTLQSHGFQILMDDFGSGYSSLNMLKDVPVDILKVDMRFLDDVDKNGRAANVLTSIIRMAKWLRIIVVAEGVETEVQIDFLRSIGCDRVQGFFFSKPLPIDRYEQLLLAPASDAATREQEREKLLSHYDFDALWESSQQVGLLFDGMNGAFALYERNGDALEIVRVNEGYYSLFGGTPETLFNEDRDALLHVEPDDRAALLSACGRATVSQAAEQAQVRRRHQNGCVMWLDVKLRYLGSVGNRTLFYFIMSDVTRQKELERGFLLYQYGAAMLDAYAEIAEFNFTDRQIVSIHFNAHAGTYHTRALPMEYATQYIADNRVHPDERALYLGVCDEESLYRAFREEKRRSVSVELRMHRLGQEWRWMRMTLYPMEDPGGKRRVLCCIRDVEEFRDVERVRAENRLLETRRREQERYRLMAEQTGTAVVELSADASSMECTPLFEQYRLSECDFAALCQDEATESYVHPQDAARLRAFFERARRLGPACTEATVRLVRKDGAMPWCRLRSSAFNDGDGEPRMLMTICDVDVERKSELLLKAQQQENDRRLALLTNLYWSLPCGIWQMSIDEPPMTLFINRACWMLFGYQHKLSFEAATASDLTALIVPEDRAMFLEHARVCREQRAGSEFDLRILRVDGSVGTVRGTISYETQSGGAPMLQFVFMDTTLLAERDRSLREAQKDLRETMMTLQHLLENLPVGVALLELEQPPRTSYINERAAKIFALPAADVEAFSGLLDVEAFEKECAEAEAQLVGDEDGRRIYDLLTRRKRADGTPFWMRAYLTRLERADSPGLCYAVLADVTKQVELEREYNSQSALYRILMEESRLLFFDYDIERDVMTYSRRGANDQREERNISGYLEYLKGSKVIYAEHIQGFLRAFKKQLRSREPSEYAFMADFDGKGEYRWYRAHMRTVADDSGALYQMIGSADDIHEERMTEEQLQQVKIFRRAVNSVSLFMFEFDLPDGQLRLINGENDAGAFYPFLDYLRSETNSGLIEPHDRERLMQYLPPDRLAQEYRAGCRRLTQQVRVLDRHERWIWLELTVHLSHGKEPGSIRGIGYVKEIQERKALEQRAQTDALTGLLNRATTEERVREALCEENGMCCLFIIDVDDFKSINDTYGHMEGDKLLQAIAEVLHGHFRQSDAVGRLGGDEFVALLRGVSTLSVVQDKAKELLSAVRALNRRFSWGHEVTISIGAALSPKDGLTFALLYQAADAALYEAKRGGKDQWRVKQ